MYRSLCKLLITFGLLAISATYNLLVMNFPSPLTLNVESMSSVVDQCADTMQTCKSSVVVPLELLVGMRPAVKGELSVPVNGADKDSCTVISRQIQGPKELSSDPGMNFLEPCRIFILLSGSSKRTSA